MPDKPSQPLELTLIITVAGIGRREEPSTPIQIPLSSIGIAQEEVGGELGE